MGFFDVILKSIGFEVEESEKKQKRPKEKKQSTEQKTNVAKFNFNQLKQAAPKSIDEQKPAEQADIEFDEPNIQAQIGKNIAVFAPTAVEDLKGIVDFTRKRLAAIVNLSNLSSLELEKALEFLNGAMYAMRGQVSQLDSKLYLVAPEGTATITNAE